MCMELNAPRIIPWDEISLTPEQTFHQQNYWNRRNDIDYTGCYTDHIITHREVHLTQCTQTNGNFARRLGRHNGDTLLISDSHARYASNFSGMSRCCDVTLSYHELANSYDCNHVSNSSYNPVFMINIFRFHKIVRGVMLFMPGFMVSNLTYGHELKGNPANNSWYGDNYASRSDRWPKKHLLFLQQMYLIYVLKRRC